MNAPNNTKDAMAAFSTAPCSHANRREVGVTSEGAGTVLVDWCPSCGGLKRTMTNWKYTDYPWEMPRHANTKLTDADH
jgi:hypothetical protein